MASSLLLVTLLLVTAVSAVWNPLTDPVQQMKSLEKLDQCFCELTGQVDECCCDVETVDSLNRLKVFPLISQLVSLTYFKFYQVNLHRPCPFWPDDGRCVLKDCHVEKCTEDELPAFLKGENKDSAGGVIKTCDEVSEEEQILSTIDSTISRKQQEEFKSWQEFDDQEDTFCDVDAVSSQDASFIDLTLNPERFTGYSGHSTQRIWSSIYHENCFRPEKNLDLSPSTPLFHSSLVKSMCLEKRAFYRLVSGLHASINIHLSAQHTDCLQGAEEEEEEEEENSEFGPNLREFVRRFDSSTTNGQGPSWLKNLYFAYLLVLRAVTKAESYWQEHQFYTGAGHEDTAARERVLEIVQAAKGCSSLFDESMMFTGNSSAQLKDEFRSHFRNISRIMDCVGCDKCKLWGKLQVQGVGTALKILFSKKSLRLTRSEIVALFNVLGRFSSSIHSLEMFRAIQDMAAGRSGHTGPVREDL